MTKFPPLLALVVCGILLSCWGSRSGPAPENEFRNPVIHADVPDPDIIRVGSDFYMVSTTMHLMPGVPIMRSKNLVDWEIISYVVDGLKDGPGYDLDGDDVYGKGPWAASLRRHNDTFYVFFATNKPAKSYLFSAKDPAGKWTKVMELDRLYHDASLLFDDDGRVYLAWGSGRIRITEFAGDLSKEKPGGLDKVILDGPEMGFPGLFEGTHLYRIDGKYYAFVIWWPKGGIRTQLCFRSDSIGGPYESKVILSDTLDGRGGGLAQGAVVDTEDGRWYGFVFQDRGAVGRVPVLTPCRWEEGWPVLGDAGGRVPVVMDVPVRGDFPVTPLVVSDDFSSGRLALNWQWNHNPDTALWSLTERPGYMRLRTGKVVDSIFEARNTLSQRTEGPKCSAVVSVDVSNMRDGDHAGLGAFCAQPGLLSIVAQGDKKYLVMTDRGEEKERRELAGESVFLRVDCDFNTDDALFFYSPDHTNWTGIGSRFHMVYNLDHFMGNRLAIFNYATQTAGGYVDIDFFEYSRVD